MSDPVEWLTAALRFTEQIAQAAADGSNGVWFVGPKWNVYRAEDDTPWDDDETNRLVVYGNVKPQSDHIALNNPAVVLRRIAKIRQILDLWQDPNEVRHLPAGTYDGRDPDEIEAQVAAAEAIDQVVQLLAEAWGWEQP